MATVTRYEWFDPDHNDSTGYVDVVESQARPASEVLPEFKKFGAQVALESDDLWDDTWGKLAHLMTTGHR